MIKTNFSVMYVDLAEIYMVKLNVYESTATALWNLWPLVLLWSNTLLLVPRLFVPSTRMRTHMLTPKYHAIPLIKEKEDCKLASMGVNYAGFKLIQKKALQKKWSRIHTRPQGSRFWWVKLDVNVTSRLQENSTGYLEFSLAFALHMTVMALRTMTLWCKLYQYWNNSWLWTQ